MGLNGWTDRGHDAGASLIIDGKLTFAIEEERLIRKRYSYDSKPTYSIQSCLDFSKISLDDVDAFYVGWDYEKLYRMIGQKFISKEQMSLELFGSTSYAKKIHYVEHHLAHAYSAFVPSGFERALIAVFDGQGEYMGTSIYLADRKANTLDLLYETPISLGYFYTGLTKQIGFRGGEEGKTMGLTAYGEPTFYDYLKNHINYEGGELGCSFHIDKKGKDEEEESVAEWQKLLTIILPPRKQKITLIDNTVCPYANLACSGQKLLEEIGVQLIGYYAKRYSVSNICFSGGVSLNCPMISAIENSAGISSVFVQPAANDGGVSLGAAIYGSIENGDNPEIKMIPYLGSEHSNNEIKKTLTQLGVKYKEYDDIVEIVPRLILEDKIVAMYQGRLELGPRALGNRSLIGRPDKREMFTLMNTLKGRELWRPLAPAVLFDYQSEFFSSSVFSPHMTKNMKVLPDKLTSLQAVTHVDGTARIQSVTQEYNTTFYRIIDEFYRLTGIPVLINTSFNVKGEPLVSTPENALDAFMRMKIDCLCIGNCIVFR